MILIQHFQATEKHKQLMEEAANERHRVFLTQDFKDVPDLSQTEILFTFGKEMTVDTFMSMPKLKWIQLCSTGFNHLPQDYLQNKEIVVTTAKGAHAEPISEYAFSCMLYFVRNMDLFLEQQKEKKWYRLDFPSELFGQKLVILGTGYLGKEIARKAKAFNMETIGVNRSGIESDYFDKVYRIVQLDEVLPKADYLILALPFTKQTEGLIGTKELSLLKSTAVVINVGRGELMDESAALEVLETNKIRGMAMDVFRQEPLPPDSPLWEQKGLLITPHMAAMTNRFLDRSIDRFLINYQLYINGLEMIDVADFSRGY
jgi:phosphoglycerate dehydrogenase-like enzyme